MPRARYRRFGELPSIPLAEMALAQSHRLRSHLAFYVVCQGTRARELVGSAWNDNPSASPDIGRTRDGLAGDLSGTQYYDMGVHPAYFITGAMTLAWRGIIDAGGTFRHFCSIELFGGGTDNPFDFRTDNSTPLNLALVRADAAGVDSFSGPAVTNGVLATYGVTKASGNTTATFYINGAGTASSETSTKTPTSNPSASLRIGRRSDGAVQMDGKVNVVAGWARVLTAAEMMAFHLDPYSLIEERRRSRAGLSIGSPPPPPPPPPPSTGLGAQMFFVGG